MYNLSMSWMRLCAVSCAALLCALFLARLAHASDESLRSEFERYVEKYASRKEYDAAEYERRYAVFVKNAAQTREFNDRMIAAGKSARLGLSGPFADWTVEEFRERMLMAPASAMGDEEAACTPSHGQAIPPTAPLPIPAGALAALPSSFDWRPQGAVGPVQDQGSVGTCWAFSTVENIAGQWFLAGHSPFVVLSAEQMNDCDYLDCGVFGGWPCRAYQYVIHQGGVMSDASYPYCVGTGDCYPCVPSAYNTTFCGPGPDYCNATESCRLPPPSHPENVGIDYAASIRGWTWFKNENETAIAYRLKNQGPLSVLIDATLLQFYEFGVWDSMWR